MGRGCGSGLVFTCIVCKFPVELDDAVVPTAEGRCICVRCFYRQIGDERRLSPALRRELEALLAAV